MYNLFERKNIVIAKEKGVRNEINKYEKVDYVDNFC